MNLAQAGFRTFALLRSSLLKLEIKSYPHSRCTNGASDSRWHHRFHSASCNSRQLILLLSLRGRLSTKTTERGALYLAILSRPQARIPSADVLDLPAPYFVTSPSPLSP